MGPGGSMGKIYAAYVSAKNSQFIDSTLSVVLFFILVLYRDSLTPDIFHFVMCVDDEEVHYLFVTSLWLFYRCCLEPDPSLVK